MAEFVALDRRRFAAAAAATVAAGPARALMAGQAPDSPQARLDDLRRSAFTCAASVAARGGTYSAVCIAPRFALTAGHVAGDGRGLMLFLNLGRDLSHRRAVTQVHRHPRPQRIESGYPHGDLALLELDAPLPAELELPRLARRPMRAGQRIEIAGYGGSGPGDRGMTVASHPALRRIGANRIDRVVPDAGAGDDGPLLYLFSFDPPGTGREGPAASLGNRVETGLAAGDSGSPAFTMEDGRPALVGINTFVTRSRPDEAPTYTFGTVGGGEALRAHGRWLRSVLGAEPWSGPA